jgi:hypothetical protein
MVVAELDIVGIPITPAKTNAPLIVQADTILPGTIAREQLDCREVPAGFDPEPTSAAEFAAMRKGTAHLMVW